MPGEKGSNTKRRNKARRQGGKGSDGMEEALTEVKDPSPQQAVKVHGAVIPTMANNQAAAPSVPPAPKPDAEAEKPNVGILSKKKHHRRHRHHKNKKSVENAVDPNRKQSGESTSTSSSHTTTDSRGSVVSVDVPVIHPPQPLSAPATAWPAPAGPANLQQGPYDSQSQLPSTQMQHPWDPQPQIAQHPLDAPWQPPQQLQLPQHPTQPPPIPLVGFPEPVQSTLSIPGPLQPGPTTLLSAPMAACAAAESSHAEGALAAGSFHYIPHASDTTSSAWSSEPAEAGSRNIPFRTAMSTLPQMFADQKSLLQENDVLKGVPTSLAYRNQGGSTVAPKIIANNETQTGDADRTKSEREARLTFKNTVEENVLDDEGVDHSELEDTEDLSAGTLSVARPRAGSVTWGVRKPRSTKHRRRVSMSEHKKGKQSSTVEGSSQPFGSPSALVNEPVPPTAVIINAEMAQRLIAALNKCEGPLSREATPDAPEAPQAKTEGSKSDKKLAAPAATAPEKTSKPKSTDADKLGSSEEFYEVIAEEVVETDKEAEGGQRKRIIRKTTRSRKHDVTEEPWDDGGPSSRAVPTLPRWENIQPSTSRGTGRARSSARPAREGDDTEEEVAAPSSGASRVRSVSGWPSHALDDRERTTAPASKKFPHAEPEERYPPVQFPPRRYAPPAFYGSPTPMFPYGPSLIQQPYQPATPTHYPNYAGPSWRQSLPARYDEYYQYHGVPAPYPSPNFIQMAQDNSAPVIDQSNVRQLGQGPLEYEARSGRSQRFQVSEREMTEGRPSGMRPGEFADARYGRPYQPYNDGMAGQDARAGCSRQGRQAAARIRPQASNDPGFRLIAKRQPQRNFDTSGPNRPRDGANSSEFCIAVTPRPQESSCWQSGTPASIPAVPGVAKCHGSHCAAMATAQLAPVGGPPDRQTNRSGPFGLRQPPISAPSPGHGIHAAGPSCARVAPCGCRCHEGRVTPAQGGITLGELLRREDDIRRDEQLRQLSRRLEEERIRRDAQLAARVELLDGLQRNRDAEAAVGRDADRNALYGTYTKDSSVDRQCSNAGLR